MLAPFFIFLGIDLIFIILASLFFCGKGSSLIAGYNTASNAERAKYDEKALCRAMGWLMVALAVCWFIIALNLLLDNLVFLWVGFPLFLIVCIAGIIYMNTSKKIKRK